MPTFHIIQLYEQMSKKRATLEWVDWFNNRRILEPIGDIPPAEFEQAYYDQLEGQAVAA